MVLGKGKTAILIIGSVLLPASVAGALFFASTKTLSLSKADTYSITLNQSAQPTLDSSGAGTLDVETTNGNEITWEYSNAESYVSGHVSLKHQGYVGISSGSDFGITGISGLTVNFVSNNNELWLLKSTDGVTWNEDHILESGTLTSTANNWRYIRLYNWSDNNTAININSINVSYSCDQSLRNESAKENIDNARAANVLGKSDNLTATDVAGRDTKAISFAKSNNSSSYAIISLGTTCTLDDIKYKKVEFDYYKVNTVPNTQLSYPSIQLYKDASKTVGSAQSYEPAKGKTHYKITVLGNDWYHIEMPVSALAPTISGYKIPSTGKWEDTAAKTNQEVNAVKLSVGTCIIDNLIISSSPTALGIFNNGTSFNTTDEKPYWFKVAWTGEFYSCTFSFDTPIAEQVTWDNTTCKSPFYVRGLNTGDVIVTATLVVGYNRQTLTISNTITIN